MRLQEVDSKAGHSNTDTITATEYGWTNQWRISDQPDYMNETVTGPLHQLLRQQGRIVISPRTYESCFAREAAGKYVKWEYDVSSSHGTNDDDI